MVVKFANHDNARSPVLTLDPAATTVLEFKRRVLAAWPPAHAEGTPAGAGELRAICMGRLLEDGKTLAASGVPSFDFPTPIHVAAKPGKSKAAAASTKPGERAARGWGARGAGPPRVGVDVCRAGRRTTARAAVFVAPSSPTRRLRGVPCVGRWCFRRAPRVTARRPPGNRLFLTSFSPLGARIAARGPPPPRSDARAPPPASRPARLHTPMFAAAVPTKVPTAARAEAGCCVIA